MKGRARRGRHTRWIDLRRARNHYARVGARCLGAVGTQVVEHALEGDGLLALDEAIDVDLTRVQDVLGGCGLAKLD